MRPQISLPMKDYVWKYFLPGIELFVLALFAGTHPNLWIALVGFLSFFVIGVILIIEGYKIYKKAE